MEPVTRLGLPLREAEGRIGRKFSMEEQQLFAELATMLQAHYGSRLLSFVLFGSRARGTGMERSDYDFIAFLDVCDYDQELPWLEELSYHLTLKYGLGAISLSPMAEARLRTLDEKYPGMVANIERDSIRLLG